MGHARGQQLTDKLLCSIKDYGLMLDKLLAIGSDGANINKTVKNNFNEGLVDVGTCHLHVYHNGLQKALHAFGSDVSEFVVDIKLWFKLSAARWEDYQSIQLKLGLPAHKSIKYVGKEDGERGADK